jgi:fluoride ion exporter CrcB/FEX
MPWATFLTNVSGRALIGVLMVTITELTSAHRLVRPFLGVGVLRHLLDLHPRHPSAAEGGSTGAGPHVHVTNLCSTFSYETLRLLEKRAGVYAVVNIVASVVAGLAAAGIGLSLGAAIA